VNGQGRSKSGKGVPWPHLGCQNPKWRPVAILKMSITITLKLIGIESHVICLKSLIWTSGIHFGTQFFTLGPQKGQFKDIRGYVNKSFDHQHFVSNLSGELFSQLPLAFSFTFSWKESSGIRGTAFYGPNAHPVTNQRSQITDEKPLLRRGIV